MAARAVVMRFALAAASAASALLAAEVLLNLRVLPLTEAASRYVHGCYEAGQPGRMIHAKVRSLKLRIHRPNFESDCYFLGYSWRHRSDAWGWRNPATWDTADVVVLGDSMVYGHGVEEEQTAPHHLRGLLDRRVVNMGFVGGSPVHYLAFLRNFALPLRPKVVIVLFFGNDLVDIGKTRPDHRIERFVRTGQAREMKIFPRETLLGEAKVPGDRGVRWLDRWALYRLLDYQLRAWRPSPAVPDVEAQLELVGAEPVEDTDRTPPADEILDALAEDVTVVYLRRALAVMAASTHATGAALVVGQLGKKTQADWLLRRILRRSSVEHGFHYFDSPVLEGRDRLPADGHLSEAGHRHLAEALAAYLAERELP